MSWERTVRHTWASFHHDNSQRHTATLLLRPGVITATLAITVCLIYTTITSKVTGKGYIVLDTILGLI